MPVGASADFTYVCNALPYTTSKNFSTLVGLVVEDWETSDFTAFPWDTTNSGNAPWQVIYNGSIFEGTYAARSGVIIDDQQSILSITANIVNPDTLSFYKRVSCEQGSIYGEWWDYLQFKVDGVEKGKWDGEIDWSREAYYVSAGSHTLTWTYSKDYVVSAGDDAAWIDFIIFPPGQSGISVQEHPNLSHSITSYPNPAGAMMTIQLGLACDDIVDIEIVNIKGQIVREVDTDLCLSRGIYTKSIHLNDLAAGNYFVRVKAREAILEHPFVITH
jgi:hypothetical protein